MIKNSQPVKANLEISPEPDSPLIRLIEQTGIRGIVPDVVKAIMSLKHQLGIIILGNHGVFGEMKSSKRPLSQSPACNCETSKLVRQFFEKYLLFRRQMYSNSKNLFYYISKINGNFKNHLQVFSLLINHEKVDLKTISIYVFSKLCWRCLMPGI